MNNQEYLRRQQQAAQLGCSVKTIERWSLDPSKNMPPEYDLPGGRARRLDEWQAWRNSQLIRTEAAQIKPATA
jgi:hypothetical protein